MFKEIKDITYIKSQGEDKTPNPPAFNRYALDTVTTPGLQFPTTEVGNRTIQASATGDRSDGGDKNIPGNEFQQTFGALANPRSPVDNYLHKLADLIKE